MKILNYFFLLLFLFYATSLKAQVAKSAEDISPLLVGETIPSIMVYDQQGMAFDIGEVVSTTPTLLIVFRGSWCPYCSVQLSGLAEIEQQIKEMGYQIVAISPENHEKIAGLYEKTNAHYQLYSDDSMELIKGLGIAFDSGQKRGILPVPSVYVINRERQILFEHINPNYKVRIQPDYLLAMLNALK